MNNISSPDKTIIQVLAGLRDTSAPSDLESRIRQNLAASRTESTLFGRLWRQHLQRWAVPSATPAAAACIAVFISLHSKKTAAPSTHPQVSALNAPQAASTEIVPLRVQPHSATETATLLISQAASANTTQSPTEADALMQDMLAPSQPAPPIPLTRQEKLLLCAADRADRVEIAQLEALPYLPHREDAVTQYIHQMLAPLVMAERLDPTPKPEAAAAPMRDETPETAQTPQ